MKTDGHRIRIQTRLKITEGITDLVPFIGVFFLLLIFFMMGSSFVQVSGIPVDLPGVQVRSSFGTKKLVVTVDKHQRIFLNDIEFKDMALFKNKLMELRNMVEDRTTIILRADVDAPYGVVAKIMSLAEELKINLFLLTTPPAQKTGVRLPESE